MPKSFALAKRFNLATDNLPRRIIASLDGEVGVGKTHFALTAPGPTLVQNIDKGTEGVIEKFRLEGREVYEEMYEWNPGAVDDDEESNLKEEAELKEAAIEVRNKWEKDFHYFVDNGGKTIIEDTESRIWQVYRYAEFGGPQTGDLKDFDKLNLRFEGLINKVKSVPDVNLFLIRSMKDRWGMYGKPKADGSKSFAKSGREVWGYEHLPACVAVELTFVRDEKMRDEFGTANVIKIGKCRHNDKLAWTTIPRCSFAEFGMELIEGSSVEDWQ